MIEYTLPMPPTLNQYWRHCVIKGRAVVYVSKQGKAYKAQVHTLVKAKPTDARFGVRIELSFADKRKNDIDNRIKALFDSLTGIIWHDDSQVDCMVVTRGDVGQNCIFIKIWELTDDQPKPTPKPRARANATAD